ncbi:MAG: HNH endonuclease family protein, partial [Methylococcaceae bacterium]
TALGDNLTEYIRHFLMRGGNIIKQGDVYFALKGSISTANVVDYLKELRKYSTFYQRLLHPEFETDLELQKYFQRLNKIVVTTAYPLLLNFYSNFEDNKITKDEFVIILRTLENFLIRRFVCNVPTNQLNKIFPIVYPQIEANYPTNIVEGFKSVLQSKGYPKDNEFSLRFRETKFYGAGDRLIKTKLILETLEENFVHKEEVPFKNLTIEHIMPQTLSEWWQQHIGADWEETHDLFIHTIGNLTLTAYNTELSNDNFPTKQETYKESHLELNKYFGGLKSWTKNEIEQRADVLAKQALEIWGYFGQENSTSSDIQDVTGTIPTNLKILGQGFKVESWRDVLEQTLNTIADLEPEKFEVIANSFPRHVSKDKNKFRAIRELNNGYFIEMNLSAQSIQKLCHQAMEAIELTSEDWSIEVR